MKKFSTIIIAMALVLGLGQCKKQETPTTSDDNDGMVYITVNVDNGGGRHHIEPSVGAYVFTNGDKLYVGNNGQYVGTLTYNSNNNSFSGGIYEASLSSQDYLHFYFVGGLDPSETPTTAQGDANPTTIFTVNISNQSSNLPLLSYGRSTQFYNGPNGPYSTTLRNKCALVKFELEAGTNNAVTVSNMLTTATVDFYSPGITPVTDPNTTGAITLYSESETEKWAILLPQDNPISSFTVNIGDKVYNVAGSYTITNNGYINSGIVIENATNLSTLTGDYVAQDGEVLTGTLSSTHKISIAPDATVTLKNVNINGGNSGNHAGITCTGDAIIVLEGSNTVKAYKSGNSGIFIAEGYTLTIRGSGSLYAEGNDGAGIGACDNASCGNIVIQGGDITAESGGTGSAGIGAGYMKNCGDIRIEGGTIIANGGSSAAGIGGGSIGNSSSACGNVGNITISGGNVTATGGYYAAGIGQGRESTCGIITIEFGITQVKATRYSGWFVDPPYPQCIGSYNGQNTVTVSVASGLTDSGEGSNTRTIQH